MRFELYTDKTVAQCMSAITGRLQTKSSGGRPELDGWVEKGGKFSIAVSSVVGKRFHRKTRLHALVEREEGTTVIRGGVPSGATREEQAVIFGVLLVLGLIILSSGNAMLAIVAVLIGAVLYIPLKGDAVNSTVLMKELRSTLSARDRPPKKSSRKAASSTTRRSGNKSRNKSTKTSSSRSRSTAGSSSRAASSRSRTTSRDTGRRPSSRSTDWTRRP